MKNEKTKRKTKKEKRKKIQKINEKLKKRNGKTEKTGKNGREPSLLSAIAGMPCLHKGLCVGGSAEMDMFDVFSSGSYSDRMLWQKVSGQRAERKVTVFFTFSVTRAWR